MKETNKTNETIKDRIESAAEEAKKEKKVNVAGILRGLKNAIRNLYAENLISQDDAKKMIDIYEKVEKEHGKGGFGI